MRLSPTLLALALALLAAPAAAGEFKAWLAASDGSHHQQNAYAPVDPKGDAFLIRKLDQVPLKLLRAALKLDDDRPAADQARKAKSDRLFAEESAAAKTPAKITRAELDRLIAEAESDDLAYGAPAPGVRRGGGPTLATLDRLIAAGEAGLAGRPLPPAVRFGLAAGDPKAKGGPPDRSTIGRTRPFDPDRLVNAFVRVIQAHPEFALTVSPEHAWCPEAKRYLYYGFWQRLGRFLLRRQKDLPTPLLLRSKLFLLLACGWTSRYAVTGNEAALEAKLMAWPERSLALHQVFEESYVLNRGDMYLAMLCIENVLAGNPYDKDRADKPLQKRLAYIRNDLGQGGDNYGAWYHLFGIGLYGMLRPGIVARAVAEIETLGSFFLEPSDRQEDFVNRYGAVFGMKLRRMLEDGSLKRPLPAGARVDYMTQGEFGNQGSRIEVRGSRE